MKKVIISLLLATLVSLALATPVLADEWGQPNENADWGHEVSGSTPRGSHASNGGEGWKDMPPAWGAGGVRGAHTTD